MKRRANQAIDNGSLFNWKWFTFQVLLTKKGMQLDTLFAMC